MHKLQTVIAKLIYNDGKSISIIHITNSDVDFEIYVNDFLEQKVKSLNELVNFILSVMEKKFHAAYILDKNLSKILYDNKATRNLTTLESESGAMLFLSDIFSEKDIEKLVNQLNIDYNIESMVEPIKFGKLDIDDDSYEGPDYYKGIKN